MELNMAQELAIIDQDLVLLVLLDLRNHTTPYTLE